MPANLSEWIYRRSKVDDRAARGPVVAEVGQGPLDAVDTLPDGHLRQADEDRLGQPGGGVHFHLDGDRVDADQSKGVELGEHAGRISAARAAISQGRTQPGIVTTPNGSLKSCRGCGTALCSPTPTLTRTLTRTLTPLPPSLRAGLFLKSRSRSKSRTQNKRIEQARGSLRSGLGKKRDDLKRGR